MKFIPTMSAALCLLSLSAAEPAVDRYGQYTGEEWPGKITSDDQLRAAAEREWPLIRDAAFDPATFDRFGGRLDAGTFEATGRFYRKKIDGRWWLITPAGHRYFIIGCDAVGYNESGYASPLENPDGSKRNVFAELPDVKRVPDGLPAGPLGGRKVNLLAANLEKKYGPGYDEKSKEVNRKRLISWGFNSTAKWGWGETFGLPYVEDTNFRSAKRLPNRRIDVYDPGFAAIAETNIMNLTLRLKNDPMLIAYATENENGLEDRDIRLLTAAAPDVATKQALVDFLLKRHGEAKAAQLFGVTGGREAMLANRKEIELPAEDRGGFITEASRHYHRIVADLFKKYDPEHLWFGASHCGAQSPEWIYAAAEFTDAVMLNEYDIRPRWSDALMPTLTKRDKPVFITEFSFVCNRRGYRLYLPWNTVKDQAARGLAYRHYTERLAANPLCIGFGFFIFFDQPVTRRSLPGGESFNFGLVDYTDQPYDDMIAEVKKSNARLEAVHAGKDMPFSLKDPRWLLDNWSRPWMTTLFLPGSTSEYIAVDSTKANEYFDGCPARLRIAQRYNSQGQGSFPVGTVYAGDNSTFGNIKADLYVWRGHRGKDLNEYYELEGSPDNKTFTRLPVRFELVRQIEFDHYTMSNAKPIPADIRYLRIVLKAPDASKSWSNQIADISVERK